MTTANSAPNSQDTVQNIVIQPDGKPMAVAAKARFSSAENAWNVFQKCMRDDDPAAVKRAKLQVLIDGGPPYDPSKLEALGQSWRANVNYREAESIRDSNAAAYWSLTTEVPELITVKIRKSPKDIQWQMEDWGKIIAEEYTDLLHEWEDFYYNYMLHVIEMLTFGMGPIIWDDRFNWQFKAVQHASCLIPPRTRSTIGKVKIFFIRDSMSIMELFRIIDTKDVATDMGWNIEEIRKVIVDRYAKGRLTDSDKYSVSAFESLQQMFKNNDVWQDYDDMDDLKIVHAYVCEVQGGKVSHYIFPEVESRKAFMLEETNVYGDMTQVFDPFIFNIGDGFMRSVRGVGQRMYQSIELSNRLINTTFDSAMLSSSLIVTASSKQDLRMMRLGPVTRLPEGVTPIQQSFAPNISQVIMARNMLQTLLHNNHGVNPTALDKTDMPRRTKAEVMVAEQKEAKLMNFQIAQYYVHLDRLHRETIRRLLSSGYPVGHPGYEQRKEFLKRCEERGVPKDFMKIDKLRIRATRAIGSGSATVRQANTRAILEGSAFFDERGKKNAVRDWVASISSYEACDRYAPIANRDQIMTTEHTLATLENNDLAEGKPVPVGVDQPHGIHLSIHVPQIMEFAQKIAQAMQQKQDINPAAVLPYLSAGIPHIASHVQLFAGDPRNEEAAKQFGQSLKFLQALAKHMEKEQQAVDAEKQQAQQEMAAQMQEAKMAMNSEDLKVKLAKVQADFQVRLQDATNKSKIKEMTAKHSMMLKEMKFQAEESRKNREAQPAPEGM